MMWGFTRGNLSLVSAREEKGMTEDEMAGWHHWLDGRESECTPGVGDGQGGLACCSSWGLKESDMTERLTWTEAISSSRQPPPRCVVLFLSSVSPPPILFQFCFLFVPQWPLFSLAYVLSPSRIKVFLNKKQSSPQEKLRRQLFLKDNFFCPFAPC